MQKARLLEIAACLTLLGGAAFFAAYVHDFYRIQTWLFWRYAGYWLGGLSWLSCCLSLGNHVLARTLGSALTLVERWTLGLAGGVLAFALSIFFLGLVHALHWLTFFLLPLAFFAVGARTLWRDVGRARKHFRITRLSIPVLTLPLLALGVVGLSILYFQLLSPDAYSFDTRWYHLPMGQRFALSGKVARFDEGFWQAAWPHLSSYLFAWAFLMPAPVFFDRLLLCAHLEWFLFLATLAQVPVLVRRLVPRAPVGLTWLVMLAFPGIYLYDNNLHAGADHIAAFWAIPIALSFERAFRVPNPRRAALFASFASAAFLTKYTALCIVLPPSVTLFGYYLFQSARLRTRTVLFALGTLVLVSLVGTAPNWLKNVIWYGDPVYPMLQKHLTVSPWSPDVPDQLKILHGTSRPGELTPDGLLTAAKQMVTFSFVPNNWYIFHRDVPVFGSLFTLSIPCLLFLRGARRLLFLYAHAMLAVMVWYIVSHYDRYLQAALPWMAAATASTLVLVWQSGIWPRLAMVPLLLLQVVWGSDVPFIATHNLIGDTPMRHNSKLVTSGFEQKKGRLRVYEPFPTIGEQIPKDGVVLGHDMIMILGIDRNWVTDQHQCRISYGLERSPGKIHDVLTELGTTHMVWPLHTLQRDTLAGDLAFANYATNFSEGLQHIAGYNVARLPKKRPAGDEPDYDVAYIACAAPYRQGWYKLSDLVLPVVNPGRAPKPRASVVNIDEVNQKADFVVYNPGCYTQGQPGKDFHLSSHRGQSQLWVRRLR
jgi:hypothetical protein